MDYIKNELLGETPPHEYHMNRWISPVYLYHYSNFGVSPDELNAKPDDFFWDTHNKYSPV